MSTVKKKIRFLTPAILSLFFVIGCETVPSGVPATVADTGVGANDLTPASEISANLVAELSSEVRVLTDRVELLEVELKRTQERQKQLYDDIDLRLRKLERTAVSETSTAPDTPSVPASQPDATSGGVSIEVQEDSDAQSDGVAVPTLEIDTSSAAGVDIQVDIQEESDREVYDRAFRTLRDGEYEDSIVEFQKLIQMFPKSQLIDDAWYWIAEAYYVTQNFEAALPVFEQLAADYPDSQRASDSILKIGYIYYDLGDYANAQNYLNEVIDKYPASRSAFSARRRLDKMKREGQIE